MDSHTIRQLLKSRKTVESEVKESVYIEPEASLLKVTQMIIDNRCAIALIIPENNNGKVKFTL